MKNYFLLTALVLLVFSCKKSDHNDLVTPKYPNMLIVVESSITNAITSKLNTYISDIASGDSSAKVISWTGTNAKQLKDTIEKYYTNYHIKGVFLIGNLPVAMYEMDDWGDHEEFPFDIYYASPGTDWTDADQDGIFDGHTSYHVSYFTGRITGTTTEINNYLDKAHKYRTQGSSQPKRGYMFVDDDWYSYYYNNKWGLDYIYSNVNMSYDTNTTTKSEYQTYLSGSGAEYVNQLVHAAYNMLYFTHHGAYQTMSLSELISLNPKACFYNMFNCSGCRYTEDNLGMSYVMKTDKGLAVMGSTKTGGNYYPQSFNLALAQNKTWGQAFVTWWNDGGTSLEDKWKLGLVILGDPMLRVPADHPIKSSQIVKTPPDPELVKYLEEIILKEKGNRK